MTRKKEPLRKELQAENEQLREQVRLLQQRFLDNQATITSSILRTENWKTLFDLRKIAEKSRWFRIGIRLGFYP